MRYYGNKIRHGSITFLSITIKLQLHFILPITITITFSCLLKSLLNS